MNSLSRREEETLLKTTKAYALRECDALVRGPFYDYSAAFANSSLWPQNSLLVHLAAQFPWHGRVGIS